MSSGFRGCHLLGVGHAGRLAAKMERSKNTGGPARATATASPLDPELSDTLVWSWRDDSEAGIPVACTQPHMPGGRVV
jgi:hypothetical protein